MKKNTDEQNKPMIKRILSLAAIVATLTLTTSAVQAQDGSSTKLTPPGTAAKAGESQPYNSGAFAKAKADGKTVLVDFAASWCPTCRKQGPVIESLLKEDKFKGVVAFKADFDTEKELQKQLKVTGQSTLIVFKGDKEVGRSMGITDKAAIGELIAKGL